MSKINWKTGVYTAPGMEDQKSTFRVTLASDWGALWDYADLILNNSLAVYGDLLPLFRSSDLNVVNVECALGHKGSAVKKGGPNLRGSAASVQALSGVPFHLGCLANNHIMDFGPESLEETIGILHSADIKTVGAGLNAAEAAKPAIVQVKGAVLGIMNCAEGEGCASIDGGPGANPFNVPAVKEQIYELTKRVDAVLVVFHGGREYAPSPPPYVIDGLRQFAEAGACAVIAHHPHVPQGVEIHRGVPIAYSQGNFVFRWAATRGEGLGRYFISTGYLVHVDFVGKQLSNFSLTPYRMKPDGVFALTGEEKAQLLSELERVSSLLADSRATRQLWDAFVDSIGQEDMMSTMNVFLNQFKDDHKVAAARLHNLFFCPAHRELYLNGLKRLSHGELGDSPEWAKELVADWGQRTL